MTISVRTRLFLTTSIGGRIKDIHIYLLEEGIAFNNIVGNYF
jgi:hypothetical protein